MERLKLIFKMKNVFYANPKPSKWKMKNKNNKSWKNVKNN